MDLGNFIHINSNMVNDKSAKVPNPACTRSGTLSTSRSWDFSPLWLSIKDVLAQLASKETTPQF